MINSATGCNKKYLRRCCALLEIAIERLSLEYKPYAEMNGKV